MDEELQQLEAELKNIGLGQVASVSGRFWAMDRDNRWERIEKAYRAMVLGEAEQKSTQAQPNIKRDQ